MHDEIWRRYRSSILSTKPGETQVCLLAQTVQKYTTRICVVKNQRRSITTVKLKSTPMPQMPFLGNHWVIFNFFRTALLMGGPDGMGLVLLLLPWWGCKVLRWARLYVCLSVRSHISSPVYTIQPVVNRLDNRLYKHPTGCQTGCVV